VFEPSVLDLIEPNRRVSIERDTFPRVVAGGDLYGVATDDYWIDAGRPDLYRAANLDLLGSARRHEHCEPLHADAVVADSATIENSIVGPRAVVDDGAHVVDSVILPGAHVESGARVCESLVMGRIGARATIVRCTVGADGVVGPEASLTSMAVPPVE
jgi:mannose-1-phosphate guanylyltransferase